MPDSRPSRAVARTLALAGLCSVLGGCASSLQSEGNLLGIITPYRIDIVQGNVVTKEQLALVRPGMTRVQVRDVLGSPLLTDLFHADRWDYVFTIKRPGTAAAAAQRRRALRGRPADAHRRARPAVRARVRRVDQPHVGQRARRRMLELTAEQRAALAGAAASLPRRRQCPRRPGPVRDYPPLESN